MMGSPLPDRLVAEVERRVEHYGRGGTLDSLAWSLEEIVIYLEDQHLSIAEKIQGCWSDLEIINALNLEGVASIIDSEVDELIDEFLRLLKEVS